MTFTVTMLIPHLAQSRLALFLGADLSQALTGLPSRSDLARGLARRKGLDESLSLAAVAQRAMQGGSRFEFTDYLGRQLDRLGKQPQRIHQLIAKLPAQTVITTAYDNMLELAFQQAGEPINRLVRDSDIAFADPRRRTLIKLYGDVQQRDSLVVTEDDHLGLWGSRDKESLLDEARAALRKNVVLFLGYNLADPDFNLLWREVLDRMGRFALGAYAIWPGASDDDQQVWKGRQVQVIAMEPLDLLEQLSAALAGEPVASPPTARGVAPDDMALSGEEERQLLRRERDQHKRNLYKLEEKKAKYGELEAPISVLNQIEDEEREIARIDAALAAFEDSKITD
jgi:hypothetical protein